MAKKILTTPIKAEDLEDIRIGDIIYLNGHIVTCRDVAHRRLIEGGRELPVDVNGGAIFHAGPIVRPVAGEDGRFEMVSVGPTTSMRMEKFEKDFIRETGVKVIVGKGGMGGGPGGQRPDGSGDERPEGLPEGGKGRRPEGLPEGTP